MDPATITTLCYILGASLFIVGLKMLSSPQTARKGNCISAIGMLIAVIATLISKNIVSYHWIAIGLVIGATIGALLARFVAMTAMPEMVALLNGFGGLASFLVSWGMHHHEVATLGNKLSAIAAVSIPITALIGGVTFTGSMIAWAKLKEVMSGKPILFRGINYMNAALLLIGVLASIFYAIDQKDSYSILIFIMVLSFILGVTSVIPIGGADMPVVISLLNSYSGIAAATAGFIILNTMLIVAGSLVGASGIILTIIMCKGMNRSLTNVLFSGFGSTSTASTAGQQGEAKPVTAKDTYYFLDSASSVVIVPGYGLAVAQAQRTLRELGDILERRNCEVRYAIHPVAGRMPGHMNILLAEADVPYEQLVEMDSINPTMPSVDVCIVVGANDVVNPAAREDEKSPIYGMPIIDADKAKIVIVLKRSMASGFAGIENPLFFKPNTRMLFGNAKNTLQELVNEFKEK